MNILFKKWKLLIKTKENFSSEWLDKSIVKCIVVWTLAFRNLFLMSTWCIYMIIHLIHIYWTQCEPSRIVSRVTVPVSKPNSEWVFTFSHTLSSVCGMWFCYSWPLWLGKDEIPQVFLLFCLYLLRIVFSVKFLSYLHFFLWELSFQVCSLFLDFFSLSFSKFFIFSRLSVLRLGTFILWASSSPSRLLPWLCRHFWVLQDFTYQLLP